ncbi:hypothetical protein AM493_15495 [Flavobacterium akiainvivens]|uniref:DUF2975 domain-containing protein n=1 Tax=Flavobacterium akiainvivens TaxID=1202724 RepID=A0A0M8MCH1_9FLAO|nr:DUF2975 domain-containing protein [Flavobacterium akiainvivens]KOS07285.1 hypothetical protein AM493_15495 [Flavobacterium akiainvivens]SFQ46195.1 Protein of unknown function [Flavobacterium akiainvivens]
MKRLSLLKNIVSIFFVLCMVGLFFGLPLIIMLGLFPEKIPFPIDDRPATEAGLAEILLYLAEYVAMLCFVYALYLFKKTLVLFEKKRIFSVEVIALLNKTGKAIVAGCVIDAVSIIVFDAVVEGSFESSIENMLDSTLLILGLGLFFIVLGDVFAMAKQLKEENDLTV